MKANKEVVVLIGSGSIGVAIARRVGVGKHILLADLRKENADAPAKVMSEAGYEVSTTVVDISSKDSIRDLVKKSNCFG